MQYVHMVLICVVRLSPSCTVDVAIPLAGTVYYSLQIIQLMYTFAKLKGWIHNEIMSH